MDYGNLSISTLQAHIVNLYFINKIFNLKDKSPKEQKMICLVKEAIEKKLDEKWTKNALAHQPHLAHTTRAVPASCPGEPPSLCSIVLSR